MPQPVSKTDVYLDDKGNFVKGDDPNVALQIAHKGVEIPRKVAARHGLNPDGSHVQKAAADKPVEQPKKPELKKPVSKL